MSAAGEYLPPLVTVLKGDVSDLARAFKEAKALKDQYKRDMESISDSLETVERQSTQTERSTTELGDSLERTGRRGRQSATALTKETEALKRSTRGVRDETRDAGREVTEFERLVTNKMRLGETATSALRNEWHRLHGVVAEARKELAKPFSSQNGGAGGSLLGALADIDSLERMARQFAVTLTANVGSGIFQSIGSSISSSLSALGPIGAIIVGVIIAGIIAGAPAIAGTIATVVGLGLGVGVIALGASILKNDKELQKEWDKLTKKSSTVFNKAAQPLKKPFMEVLKFLEGGFGKLEKPLTRIFAAAAPLVMPLAGGLFGAFQNALPGIEQSLINLQPVFAQLGEDLPLLGTAFGDFLTTVTEHGPEMSLVLHDIIYVASGGIMMLGELLGWLLTVYATMRDFGKTIKDGLHDAWKSIKGWANDLNAWAKNALREVGAWLMFGFVGGMIDAWNALEGKVRSLFGGVKVVAQGELQSHSPSRVFMQLGRDTVAGYVIGIEQSKTQAWAAWAGLISPRGGRGSYNSGGAAMSLASAATGASAAAAGGGIIIHNVLKLDGKTVYESQVPYAQRGGMRNSTTGLTRSGVGVVATA